MMTTSFYKIIAASVLLVGVSGQANAMWRSGLNGLRSSVSRLGTQSMQFGNRFIAGRLTFSDKLNVLTYSVYSVIAYRGVGILRDMRNIHDMHEMIAKKRDDMQDMDTGLSKIKKREVAAQIKRLASKKEERDETQKLCDEMERLCDKGGVVSKEELSCLRVRAKSFGIELE